MKVLILSTLLLLFSGFACAQAVPFGQTVLVVPFENQSKAPGIEWVGDSFPELFHERLDSPTIYVVPRAERLRAYDRMGIPSHLHPSRVTIYRIAEQMDVDYVVLGRYDFDGQTFTAEAQLLDMRRPHLLPEIKVSGPLVQLIEIQSGLAWDILHTLYPQLTISRSRFVEQTPTVRLDAFENYVEGVAAANSEQQIQHLREALRLNPHYTAASLALGEAYYRTGQYDEAIASLSEVPSSSRRSEEASFYLGLAAYNREKYEQAETAFEAVAARLPLAEIYNDLAVVLDHRDRKLAVQDFQKAVTDDPNDGDYRFNLAVELYRNGDRAGAARQLRECVTLKPSDSEAKSLLATLDGVPAQPAVIPASVKLPQERLRTEYDESSFRELALKLAATAELHLSRTDTATHAQFHVTRGDQLMAQGFLDEAEAEFREAVSLNPKNDSAHSGLAAAIENRDPSAARSEAEIALRLRPSAATLLVLARLDLKDNKPEAAGQDVDQALRLEPGNPAALALKSAVAAKLAQEAPPLPNR